MLRYAVVFLFALFLSVGAAHAESPAEVEFPHIEEIIVRAGSYRTVVAGYVAAGDQPALAIVFRDMHGTMVVDELLEACEFWDVPCGAADAAAVAEASRFATWATEVMNGLPRTVHYVDEARGGLTLPHAYQFLRDAATAVRYPGLPGRWVQTLELGHDGFTVWLEANYPNGGAYYAWDSRSKTWYTHASSSGPEWRALDRYSLAVLNGQPAPDDLEHPQLEEYGEWLRALRDFQRSAVHSTFAPVVGR